VNVVKRKERHVGDNLLYTLMMKAILRFYVMTAKKRLMNIGKTNGMNIIEVVCRRKRNGRRNERPSLASREIRPL